MVIVSAASAPSMLGGLYAPAPARTAHARVLTQQVITTMAARGHVQDPNDRRLRPIYGEFTMETQIIRHV